MPGETDYYRFAAKKNEEITFSMIARYLMPFIGDGVPGHFQPVLEVVDAKGKSLAFADDNYFDPDPVLFFKAPADGEYTLVVRDALYRGREDFVYRIRAVHGKPEYTVMPPPEFPGVKIIDAASLNRNEPAARPVMVRGVMEKGRKDSYLFEAQKGERIIFEVFARRLKSPLDSLIQVYDGKGKRIAVNDDCERLKAGVILHGAADSYLDFTVPADGRYCVMFNTKSQSEVKVDGELAFRREPGSMAPSFHRAPWNQSAMLDLKQGVHVLEAEMTRVPEGQLPNWVVGVAYGDTMQWVPDAFLNVE